MLQLIKSVNFGARKTGLILIILILLLAENFVSASDVRNIQDNYRFIYTLRDADGNPVAGETVVLRIQKVSSGYWYDFNDNTFKGSGWTSPTANLSYDATGEFYYYLFNPPASETAADEYVFVIDNASVTYGDHQSETICYQDIGNSDFDYAANQVTVAANNDKTGYSISGTKTTLDALNDVSLSGIWGYATRTLTGTSDPTASVIADAVWDEAIAGHLTAGSTGKKLSEMPSPYNVSPGY